MKKILFALGLLFLFATPSWARTATWDGGDAGALASTAANWDTDTAPIAGDTIVFDGTSADNCTWDLAISIASINTTGYGGLVTASASFTVTGNITFANNTFAHGSQTVTIGNTSTITTNTGNPFYALTMTPGVGKDITLGSDVTVNNTFTLTGANYVRFLGSYVLRLKGDVTCGTDGSMGYGSTGAADSVASISIEGSGNQAIDLRADASYPHRINIDVNSSGGTVTFANTTHQLAKSFTKTAGTVDFTTNTSTVSLSKQSGDASLMSATFYNLTFNTLSGSLYTTTLQGDVTVNNTTSLTANTGYPTLNGYKLYMKGDVVTSATSNFYAGTTDLYISGTGTQAVDFRDSTYYCALKVYVTNSGTVNFGNVSHYLKNDLIFNGTGTYNLAGTLNYKTGTITFTAGTISAGTSVLSITGAATLNTNGMSWYDVTMGANITLGSNLTLTRNWTKTAGTLSGAYAVVFNGTSTASGATAFYSLTINSGKTLNLTTAQTFSTNASGTFTAISATISSTTGTDAILNVNGSQSVALTTATDIDSSGGSTVHNYLGTNTGTINWDTAAAATPVTTAYTWVG